MSTGGRRNGIGNSPPIFRAPDGTRSSVGTLTATPPSDVDAANRAESRPDHAHTSPDTSTEHVATGGREHGEAARNSVLDAVTKAGTEGLAPGQIRTLTGLPGRRGRRAVAALLAAGVIYQDRARRVYPVTDAAGRAVAAPDEQTAGNYGALVVLAGDRDRIGAQCDAVAASFDLRQVPPEWRGQVAERAARLREIARLARHAPGRVELDRLAELASVEVTAATRLRGDLDTARETARVQTRARVAAVPVTLRRVGTERRYLHRERAALRRVRTLTGLRCATVAGEPIIAETAQPAGRPHGVADLLALYDRALSGPATRIVSTCDPALVASSRDLGVWNRAGHAFVAAAESQIAALLRDLDRQETTARANGVSIEATSARRLSARTGSSGGCGAVLAPATAPTPLPPLSSGRATSCTECHRPAVVALSYGDPDLGGDEYVVCAEHARTVRSLHGVETALGRLTDST